MSATLSKDYAAISISTTRSGYTKRLATEPRTKSSARKKEVSLLKNSLTGHAFGKPNLGAPSPGPPGIYRIPANPGGEKERGRSPAPSPVLVPEAALRSRLRVALSSAQVGGNLTQNAEPASKNRNAVQPNKKAAQRSLKTTEKRPRRARHAQERPGCTAAKPTLKGLPCCPPNGGKLSKPRLGHEIMH